MECRELAHSGIDVSVVTFGAWAIGGWCWGGADETDAVAAIRRAIDLGVTAIDTAAVYGFGRSEEIVGKAIAGRRDEVRILTKFGLRWERPDQGEFYFDTTDVDGTKLRIMRNSRPDSVIEECEQSLRRLGVDCIDLYQVHRSDPTTPIEDTFAALDTLLKQGKIRAVGVSNFTVEQMEIAHAAIPLASCQPAYSMVNRRAETDVLPFCREHGIGVIVYSPLQRGLLTGKIGMDHIFAPHDSRPTTAHFQPANRRKILALLDELAPIAEANNCTLAQLAIHWAIGRDGVTAALVGARSPAQVEENVAAASVSLSPEDTQRIDELLDDLELDL